MPGTGKRDPALLGVSAEDQVPVVGNERYAGMRKITGIMIFCIGKDDGGWPMADADKEIDNKKPIEVMPLAGSGAYYGEQERHAGI
jgi:hypothetical protein